VEKKRRVSVRRRRDFDKRSQNPNLSPSLTHPVHRELPGGLIHEHQDLQEKVVRQIGKGKAGGSGSGEDYFARVEAC